jgi:hypothetical protein
VAEPGWPAEETEGETMNGELSVGPLLAQAERKIIVCEGNKEKITHYCDALYTFNSQPFLGRGPGEIFLEQIDWDHGQVTLHLAILPNFAFRLLPGLYRSTPFQDLLP